MGKFTCQLGLLVFLSGSAALIYEIVWHRYLIVLLGAQSTATSTILGVFLSGLGLGYLLFGEIAENYKGNRLKVFSWIEFTIGIWGIAFPWLFKIGLGLVAFFYARWGIESRWIDFVISVLFILPQSILMGATIPLLTSVGSLRTSRLSSWHAYIYGLNTLGAMVGALGATLILLPKLSLTQCMFSAASLNIFVGLFSPRVFNGSNEVLPNLPEKAAKFNASDRWGWFLILLISFATGYFTLSVENILVRYLALSIGFSNLVFGLVVAAFVLGIGSGGIRASMENSVTWEKVTKNLFLTVIFFSLLLLSISYWPYYHHLYRIIFRNSVENFPIYQGGVVLCVLALFFIPTFYSGYTLPYLFSLSSKFYPGVGRRVGWIYSINTIGCLLGALVGGHWLVRWLGLGGSFRSSLYLLGGMAFFSLFFQSSRKVTPSYFTMALAFLSFSLVVNSRGPDPQHFNQAFRITQPIPASYLGRDEFTRRINKGLNHLVYEDGPDSSVAIIERISEKGNAVSVVMSGKSDGDTQGDRFTMELTAHLPVLFGKVPQDVMVVGLGTGLTVSALLDYPSIQNVDVAEISTTLLKHRKVLDRFNGNLSKSDKVNYYGMDAFRLLEGRAKSYDLIISEPSNPWMVGVENLYSREFYQLVKSQLKPGGMMAQWIQAYHFEPEILKGILNTLNKVFPYVTVWQMRDYDLLFLATDHQLYLTDIQRAQEQILSNPVIQKKFQSLGISSMESLLALEVMSEKVSREVSASSRIYSLEHARLGFEAFRARFAGENVSARDLAHTTSSYFVSMGDYLLSLYTGNSTISKAAAVSLVSSYCDNELSYSLSLCRTLGLLAESHFPSFFSPEHFENVLTSKDRSQLRRYTAVSNTGLNTAELFLFFQKNFSPLLRLSAKTVEIAIDHCLKSVDFRSKVYGECLLQKTALLEVTAHDSFELRSAMENYRYWSKSNNGWGFE